MRSVRVQKGAIALGVALVIGALFIADGVSARGNVGAPVKSSGSTGHTITVNGHGELDVDSNMATLTVGVETRGADAQSALASNSARSNTVVSAVESKGIPASHIQTSQLSIWYDSQRDAYVVDHELTIRDGDVHGVGGVLDAAVAAGVNNSWGVDFGLSDVSASRDQALQVAVADARKRADSLASALGVTISGVGSLTEQSASTPIPFGAAPAAPAAGGTNVQPGQLQITADVSVVYTFG